MLVRYTTRFDEYISMNMKNGLKGRFVHNNFPVNISLNKKQMQLAMVRGPGGNDAWDIMCDSLVADGKIDPRGRMHIDFIIVDGKPRVFH